jgi:CxC4 like cysteine cluster associated with KDZ transposases
VYSLVNSDHIHTQARKRVENLSLFLDQNFHKGHDGEYIIVPEDCAICKAPVSLQTVGKAMGGWLLLSNIQRVSVYNGRCINSTCPLNGKLVHFDGNSKAIVNWRNKMFVGVELVRRYMKQFSNTGASVNSWWQTQLWEYFDNYKLLSTNPEYKELGGYGGSMSEIVAGTAELMEFHPQVYKCCSAPKVIQMDGIALSVRHKRMPKMEHPWIVQNTNTHSPETRHSSRVHRQFKKLTDSERGILLEYLAGTLSTNWSFRLLYRSHEDAETAELDKAFKIALTFREYNTRNTVKCPTRLIKFTEMLLKDVSPICSLIPFHYRVHVRNLFLHQQDATPETKRIVLQRAPVMYDLFIMASSTSSLETREVVWSELVDFCTDAIKRLEFMYRPRDDVETALDNPTQFQHTWTAPNSDLEELWATGCYFPGYPVVRKMQHINLTREPQSELCSKHANPGGALAPGVVQFLCVEHKQCIGFVVLDAPESPRMVYEVLMTRFSENPCIVFYDNACNLLEYILNRDPYPLRNISFFVDGFHYASHKNCSPGFDTKQYPALLKQYNTSLVEQKNAKIARFKQTNPSKKYRTMVAGLRFAIALMNIDQHQQNSTT